MKNRKKLGVALGSGGLKGLYHIGVLRALAENDIQIDYLAGSSVGAWVGGHYARFKNIEKLEELTNGRKVEKLISMFEFSFSGGLIKGQKLERLLDEWLEGAQFNDLHIPFRVVATDLIGRAFPSFFEPASSRRRSVRVWLSREHLHRSYIRKKCTLMEASQIRCPTTS